MWLLFEGETIQSFSNEGDAKSAACGYLALGEFVRELGSRATEKTFRKMDANEINGFAPLDVSAADTTHGPRP